MNVLQAKIFQKTSGTLKSTAFVIKAQTKRKIIDEELYRWLLNNLNVYFASQMNSFSQFDRRKTVYLELIINQNKRFYKFYRTVKVCYYSIVIDGCRYCLIEEGCGLNPPSDIRRLENFIAYSYDQKPARQSPEIRTPMRD